MKTLENNPSTQYFGVENINFVNPATTGDVRIMNYMVIPEKDQLEILLYSHLFSNNHVDVLLRGNKVVLIITEKVEAGQSATIYVSDWQSFYPRSYQRMRNVSLILPGDNFYLLRHDLIPDEFMMKIILGRNSYSPK